MFPPEWSSWLVRAAVDNSVVVVADNLAAEVLDCTRLGCKRPDWVGRKQVVGFHPHSKEVVEEAVGLGPTNRLAQARVAVAMQDQQGFDFAPLDRPHVSSRRWPLEPQVLAALERR